MSSGSDTIVACQNVTFRDGSESSICAINDWVIPSEVLLANGTTIFLGPRTINYRFVEGVEAGFETATADPQDFFTGRSAFLVEEDGACTMSVGLNAFVSLPCGNCTICEPQTYSVDCTNIPDGAFLECQPLRPNILYPFDPTVASVSPTSAPTASMSPTSAPSSNPTLSPTSRPSEIPTEAPVDVLCPSGLIRCALCIILGIFCR